MKALLHKITFLALVISCASCAKYVSSSYNHAGKNPNICFDLGSYTMYQFSMSKDHTVEGIQLKNPVLYETPEEDDPTGVVQEMLYIFKDTTSNRVIYYTTFTHKYLFKDRGVFNDANYKDYAFINDIDNVYIGKDDGERFSFYDPNGRTFAQNIHFYYSKNEQGDLTIDKVTNSYATLKDRQRKPFVHIEDDVFGIPIRFKNRPQMRLAFKDNLEEKRLLRATRDNAPFLLKEIWFDGGFFYFSYTKNGVLHVKQFGKKRLMFIEPQ